MSKGMRWIMPLVLLIAGTAVVPAPASAASCTEGYMRCLNDSYDTSGLLRVMADMECLFEYVGCVRRKV